MASSTISASALKYASGSTWTSGRARQGVYSTTRYQGAMQFDGLSSLPLDNISISEIKLDLTFGSSGGTGGKYITLYRSAKGEISGSIASMRGSSIGAVLVPGTYNSTKAITFNASTNSAMFNDLKGYISAGNKILILYVPTTRGTYSGGFCYDYLSVESARIIVTYEYLRSSGSLVSSNVNAGIEAKLNISSLNSSYTHTVKWMFGSHTHTQNVAAGVTSASYTIPLSWLSTIPNATSGAASVVLTTKAASGTTLGTNTYSFTISAPSSVVPSLSSITTSPVNTNSAINGWGIYAQGMSKVNVWINGADGTYGSTIKSYSITTSPSIGSFSTAAANFGVIPYSGNITFTGRITDSRGRTATKTTTISVYSYAAPYFSSIEAFRSNSAGVSNEDSGTYIRLRAVFGRSVLSGSNNVTAKVRIRKDGGGYDVTTNINNNTWYTLGGGSIGIDSSYTLTFTATDTVGSVTNSAANVNSVAYVMHVKKGGDAVGFGQAAGVDNTASFGWKLVGNAGSDISNLKLQTYTHVTQLGFTWGVPTMNQVFDAMPDHSMFMGDAGNFLASDMQSPWGVLQLVRGEYVHRSFAVLWARNRSSGIWIRYLNVTGNAFDTEWFPLYDGALPASGGTMTGPPILYNTFMTMRRNNADVNLLMERRSADTDEVIKVGNIFTTVDSVQVRCSDGTSDNMTRLFIRDPVAEPNVNSAIAISRSVNGVASWYQMYHAGMTNAIPKAQGGLGANVSNWDNLRNAIGVQMRSGQTSVGTSGTNVTWSALGGAPQLITVTPNGHGASYQATVSGLSASGMTINAAHSGTTVRWCVIYFP